MATKRQRMMERIEAHGRNVLAAFPHATSANPVALAKKLRRLETQASKIGLRLCNGPEYPTEDGADLECEAVLKRVRKLLGDGPAVFINRDPRGYALKISEADAATLPIHRDFGGYGILAPDCSND